MLRTPLAWKNLTDNPRRLGLASCGVAFAVVLMFMQVGFRNALLDSPVQLVERLEADLIAISPARYSLPSEQRFPARLLERAVADAEVTAAHPVYIERSAAVVRVGEHPSRTIRVVGVPVRAGVFADPETDRLAERLAAPGSGLLDRRTKRIYGFAVDDPRRLADQQVELSGRRLRIVGTLEIGTDFVHDGNLFVGEGSFADYFPLRGGGRPLQGVDLGLIQLRPGADPAAAARRLTRLAPGQWEVVARGELVRREVAFWARATPIGIIFSVGTAMGFAVGVIICYQILFTNIHDHLAEFATLKAMGYRNRYFVGVVVRQALYLSVIGFLPAWAVCWGLFQLIEALAGLPMLMTVPRVVLIFALTVGMCLASGVLALRKLMSADPATLF